MLERIVEEVKDSGYYPVIIDETSDISRHEQVSIFVSFALNGARKEVFVGFCKTQFTAGEMLYKLVKDELEKLNLDLQKLVGKCIDDASNLGGKAKGLAKRMEDCFLLSIYFHFHGHLLNLAV